MNGGEERIYGIHAVRRALEVAPQSAMQVWVRPPPHASAGLRAVLQLAERYGIPARTIERYRLTRLAGSSAHQGIVLSRRAAAPAPRLDELLAAAPASSASPLLLLALDGVQDPHNLGTCLRSAAGAEVDAVIVPRRRAVPVNATVRKVASGAAETVPVLAVPNLARAMRQCSAAGLQAIGLEPGASCALYTLDLRVPLVLALGGEHAGLRRLTRECCDRLVTIPLANGAESLNVGAAAAVALFEAVRQRRAG